MSPQTLKALPLKFARNSDTSYAPSVALVPPTVNLAMELNKGIKDKKIRIITAPRATAMDGLNAQITSMESRALFLSPLARETVDASEARKQWVPDFATVHMETGLNCTPLFHGNLIKLFTRATLNDRSVNVTSTHRDGETIAIAMPADKANTANRTVIFITPRVLKRAGDDANLVVPGT